MAIVRFCTRIESIPFDATEVVTLRGPTGSINENTNLPYIWRFVLFNKESNNSLPEFKIEKKLKNCHKRIYNMITGDYEERLDFIKLFPHKSLEELAKEFDDEWKFVDLNSYVANFHNFSYKVYCNNMDKYESSLKTDFEIKQEKVAEQDRLVRKNVELRLAQLQEFEDDLSDDNDDDF